MLVFEGVWLAMEIIATCFIFFKYYKYRDGYEDCRKEAWIRAYQVLVTYPHKHFTFLLSPLCL